LWLVTSAIIFVGFFFENVCGALFGLFVGLFWHVHKALLGLYVGLFACHNCNHICRARLACIYSFGMYVDMYVGLVARHICNHICRTLFEKECRSLFGLFVGFFWHVHRALLG